MTSIPTPGLTSVVVVTWNGAGMLSPCIDSLEAQTGLELPLEIVVVDNGSTDGTLALLAERHPGVTVVALATNTGFTGGANAGIRAARGDVVGLLNNDAVADPAFAARARATLEAHPDAAVVTGLIVLDGTWSPAGSDTAGSLTTAAGRSWTKSAVGEVLVNSTGGEVTSSANGRDRDWLVPVDRLSRESGEVSAFSGGAAVLRRAALDAVGLFDERLFMYYEDSDLSWRLRRAGWGIRFEREARVVHQHAASSGTESPFFLWHNERNRLLFALKHAPVSIIITAFARTFYGVLRALRKGDGRSARRKLSATASALRQAPGMLRARRDIDASATASRGDLWRSVPRD